METSCVLRLFMLTDVDATNAYIVENLSRRELLWI